MALIKSNEAKSPLSWSPDGRFSLYLSERGVANCDLWVILLEGHQDPVPFLRTEFDERDGRFSADGRCAAYKSNESNRYEVYVRPFSPGSPASAGGAKWLISSNGGGAEEMTMQGSIQTSDMYYYR